MSGASARISKASTARHTVVHGVDERNSDWEAARRFAARVDLTDEDMGHEPNDNTNRADMHEPDTGEHFWAGLVEMASRSDWRMTIELHALTGQPSRVEVNHDGHEMTMLLTTSSPALYQAWSAALPQLDRELRRRWTLPFSSRLEYTGASVPPLTGTPQEPAQGE